MLYLLEFADNVKLYQGEEEDLVIVRQLLELVFKAPVKQESYAVRLVHANYYDPNAEVNLQIPIEIPLIYELNNVKEK